MKAGDLLMRTRVITGKKLCGADAEGCGAVPRRSCRRILLGKESGHPVHVLRYRAFRPRGVVVISHGFTENAEKYKEIVYYFIKEHFHVYLPEHCGHGKSYRLVEDPSLVYVDSYHRYVEDLLFVARKAKAEACGLPARSLFSLDGRRNRSSSGRQSAASVPESGLEFADDPSADRKSAVRRCKTDRAFACATERGTQYVVGQKPSPGNRKL